MLVSRWGSRATRFFGFLLLLSTLATSTEGQSVSDGSTGFSIGALRTQAEETALRIAFDLIKQINLEEVQIDRPTWLVFFTPQVSLETGSSGAFSSIVAKLAGTLIAFDTVVVEGITTPDSRFFHMVPVAAGLEANRSFSSVNGILEAGWTPWFQGAVPSVLKSARAGVFVQGGYKFERDTTTAASDETQPDASGEDEGEALLRVKASLRWSPVITLPESRLTLMTGADGWLDLANGEQYYRIEGTLRTRLFQNNFIDLKWERGAGAPTFNQGNQFSANLTVLF
ncbi:MAG: hypothetical protein ACREM1_22485 [Longimicrobiales bacterium]